jgi:hypothetical protein
VRVEHFEPHQRRDLRLALVERVGDGVAANDLSFSSSSTAMWDSGEATKSPSPTSGVAAGGMQAHDEHMLALVLMAALGADGGVSTDGGVSLDGGLDGGVPEKVVNTKWTWFHADGGFLTPDGVTDTLTMRVGEVAHIHFDLPIILMQCDEPLLSLDATLDTLLLKAIKPGKTRCGFWYRKNSYHDRTMELNVSP